MPSSRPARNLTLAGLLILGAIFTAGCSHRGLDAGAGAEPSPTAARAADVSPAASLTPAASLGPPPAPTAAVTPVPSPDLSTIDGLIKDITNDLDADASAGADEGSTP